MKLFRAHTEVATDQPLRTPSKFSDWYEGQNEAEAREAWAEDCHRYGLLMDKTTVRFEECDPKTLKPLQEAAR